MPTLALLLADDGTILEVGPSTDPPLGADDAPIAGTRLTDHVIAEERDGLAAWLAGDGERTTARLSAGRATPGPPRSVELAKAPLIPAEGGATRVCILRWGETVGTSGEELRQLQRLGALGQLAGGLAHDLNNFLTAIVGYSSLALMKTEESDPRHRLLAPLKDCTDRAAALVNRMLTFSRSTTSGPRPLAVGALVESALSMVRPALPHGIELEVQRPEPELWTVGDSVELEQVLVNLCVNARDALEGEGRLTVGVERVFVSADQAADHPTRRVGHHVAVDVSDTGGGMPPEVLGRIFDAFFTTKAPGSGTGLGLANVARIVTDHGGFVEVESTPGRGTRFRVHLPEAQPPELPAEPDPEQALVPGSGTVLVVSGDDPTRGLVLAVLVQAGYTPISALNTGEALLVFGMHRDDVRAVVLDEGLAPLEGQDCGSVLRRVRPDLPVVRLDAASEDGDDAITAHLPKPFDASGLSAALASLLRA